MISASRWLRTCLTHPIFSRQRISHCCFCRFAGARSANPLCSRVRARLRYVRCRIPSPHEPEKIVIRRSNAEAVRSIGHTLEWLTTASRGTVFYLGASLRSARSLRSSRAIQDAATPPLPYDGEIAYTDSRLASCSLGCVCADSIDGSADCRDGRSWRGFGRSRRGDARHFSLRRNHSCSAAVKASRRAFGRERGSIPVRGWSM